MSTPSSLRRLPRRHFFKAIAAAALPAFGIVPEIRRAEVVPQGGDHPWVPTLRTEPTVWADIVEEQVTRSRRGGFDVMVLGDAFMQGWDHEVWQSELAPLGASNYGIGGDGPENVLWRIDHGILDGPAPKAAILMVGLANYWRKHSAADVNRGIETVLDRMQGKLVDTPILVLNLLPALGAEDPIRPWITAVNQRLTTGVAKRAGVHLIDTHAALINKDGTLREGCFTTDELHLSQQGYAVLTETLKPTLDVVLQKHSARV
jgi:hypothetical protein